MPITFVGDYPKHPRVKTGCLSLDLAVAGNDRSGQLLGMPLRCGYQVYSKETGIGKTTISMSLIGILGAKTNTKIAIAPVDTFDIVNIESILTHAEYDNSVIVCLKENSHSETLDDLVKALSKKGVGFALLDSAYAAMSSATEEGESEDANVGRDAKMISTFTRQIYGVVSAPGPEDKTFFVTNMLFPDMGGGRKGFGPIPMSTARGVTLRGLTSIHIKLTQQYRKNKAVKSDLGRLIHGKIEKNNFGPTNREFDIYVIGGIGIHVGLTAMYDCLTYGLAEEVKGAKVSIDGQVLGSIRSFHESWQDPSIFDPFIQALKEHEEEIVSGKKKIVKEVVADGEEQTPEELYEG